MSRIADRFAKLRKHGERAFVPFITAGDPDLATSEAIVLALAEAGADVIEIGVPFSDPIADGPTIQRATERALANGTTLRRVLELARRVRAKTDVPLALMGSANPYYTMGAANFAKAAADAGVDGVLVPDLPPEEGADLYGALERAGVDGILLAAPTTTEARMKLLAQKSRGFLYFVSLTGITGARATLAADLEANVRRARAAGPLPVCVGFGISTPEHARAVGAYADGIAVGSALVNLVERAKTPDEAVDSVAQLATAMKAALRG
jgi:tryptophan synthase alpha chain